MQKIKITSKQKLLWVLLSTIAFNPAMAKSDKQAMGDVQKAREMKRHEKGNHSKHIKFDGDQKFRGVYFGYLPCDDCNGIKTTLSLKNKNNYLLVTQPARDPSREFYEKGKYTWDKTNERVTLTPKKGSEKRLFFIKDESTLIQLDKDGKINKKDQADYTLERGDTKKSREVHIH